VLLTHPLTGPAALTHARAAKASAAVAEVSLEIFNSGAVAGAEVVQLYITFPASAQEPPLQLKAFKKVLLEPGAAAAVKFSLSQRDVSIWDEVVHQWKAISGEFVLSIGASSRDIRQKVTIKI
jgi:beta-glucosidase